MNVAPPLWSMLVALLFLFDIPVAHAAYVAAPGRGASGSASISSSRLVPLAFGDAAAALPANVTITTASVEGLGKFGVGAKALGTVLALSSAALTTITYAILIGPGTRLLSTSKLPLSSIEENLSSLLSRAWPATSASAEVKASAGTNISSDAIRLLYVGRMAGESERAARGVEECEGKVEEKIAPTSTWLTTGSSLTKSMVQLAVWQWMCFWMVLAMLVSTLSFNGLLTNQRGPDSLPRLIVVLMYIAAYCGHSWYVSRVFGSFLTLTVAGATWSLLNKASFASVDLRQLVARLEGDGAAPLFKQIGKPATSSTFPVCPASLLKDVGILPAVNNEAVTDLQKSEAATVGDWQKRDVTATVEAAKAALQGVVTNVMTMVGIVITTGFSVWTSRSTAAIAETTQLGSLALLASLTLGSAAMFTSAVELSVMHASFRNVLFLKEVMINGEASAHVQKRSSKRNVIGFMHKTVKVNRVKMRHLMKMSRILYLIVFGPAFVLLPSVADHERQSSGAQFELNVSVREKRVAFTTGSTNRHRKKDDGTNVEAINVCYDPGTL